MAWIEGSGRHEGGGEIVCKEDDWLVTSLPGCEEDGKGVWRTRATGRISQELSQTEDP